MVNEEKKILLPLIKSFDQVSHTTIRVFMVSGKQFEKEVKRNGFCFAIIPRGPSCGSNGREIEYRNDQEIDRG